MGAAIRFTCFSTSLLQSVELFRRFNILYIYIDEIVRVEKTNDYFANRFHVQKTSGICKLSDYAAIGFCN